MFIAESYEEYLGKGLPLVTFTKGVSMKPLLWEGHTYVGIRPADNRFEINDVLAFTEIRRGEKVYILHRLIRMEGDVCITRGDNCLSSERVPREAVLGVLTDIYWKGSERHINVAASKTYKCYVSVWNALWPLRRLAYKARRQAALLYHRMKD